MNQAKFQWKDLSSLWNFWRDITDVVTVLLLKEEDGELFHSDSLNRNFDWDKFLLPVELAEGPDINWFK